MRKIDTEQLKKWAPLSAAAVLGLAAAGLGYAAVSTRTPASAVSSPQAELARIVVAARDLVTGHELVKGDLAYMRIDARSVPKSAYRDMGELLVGEPGSSDASAKGVASGRVLSSDLAAGSPVMARHLAPLETTPGVAAMLPKGLRAMSLDVQADAGLKGLLKPGSRVDVVATLNERGEVVARTIVQDVFVLAVGGKVLGQEVVETKDDPYKERDERQNATLTLVVTPEQAARLDMAFTNGRPRLVLRGGGDRAISRFEGLTFADLTGIRRDREGNVTQSYAGTGYAGEDAFAPFDVFQPYGTRVGREYRPTSLPEVLPPSATLAPATPAGSAGLDTSDVESPKPAPTPVPQPAPRQPVMPRFVEVIRGGSITREAFPQDSGAAPQSDPR